MAFSLSKPFKSFANKTRLMLFFTGILNEPFVALFALLPFILRKDLKANLFQLSILAMLKPVMAVFSFYWSAILTTRRDKLRSNLIGAWFLARIAFLFLFFIHNIWFVILCASLYCLFYRASTPALMEILKINLQKHSRETTFSTSSIINYSISVIIGLYAGVLLDAKASNWKLLFFFSALISLSAIILHKKLPITGEDSPINTFPTSVKVPLLQRLTQPWKDSFFLLKLKPDFLHFQIGFMAGGIGLMIMIPSSILFYTDILSISHSTISISRLFYMGLGFIIFSPIWRHFLKNKTIEILTAFLCFCFFLFPYFLLLSLTSIFWLFFALFFYGVAQAGSHLIWHLSGPIYAKQENSALYTTVNILTVGIRGLIAPLIGIILCKIFNPIVALITGSIFCLIGTLIMVKRPAFLPIKNTSSQKKNDF